MNDLVQITDRSGEKETKKRAPILSIERPTRKREPGPRPDWLKVTYRRNEEFTAVETIKTDLKLVTVCEEARCPNIDECWSAGTATFMLMGDICTRRCGFCAVGKGKPLPLDVNEPKNTGVAIKALGVKHAVITSVNRDELPDGGSAHFAETVRAIFEHSPQTRIELLVPDFLGDRAHLQAVLDAGPHIVAHNMETVPRLYRRVRPNAIYQRSLDVLEHIAESDAVSKTGLMLGLGETEEEVESVMYDLREVGCEILSLGQYLSPTTRHLAVEKWVTPDTFARLAAVGEAMGFRHVESGPMVRSSYMAHRAFEL
jgi:lipoic acid synthetase